MALALRDAGVAVVEVMGGLSTAGLLAESALELLIKARRECVGPGELHRINDAITATHEVVEPRADDREEPQT